MACSCRRETRRHAGDPKRSARHLMGSSRRRQVCRQTRARAKTAQPNAIELSRWTDCQAFKCSKTWEWCSTWSKEPQESNHPGHFLLPWTECKSEPWHSRKWICPALYDHSSPSNQGQARRAQGACSSPSPSPYRRACLCRRRLGSGRCRIRRRAFGPPAEPRRTSHGNLYTASDQVEGHPSGIASVLPILLLAIRADPSCDSGRMTARCETPDPPRPSPNSPSHGTR